MEIMLADLIRIVGSTNAMVEETRDDLRILHVKVSGLEDKMSSLDSRMSSLEDKVDRLQEEVGSIKINMATREDIQQINWRLDVHMEKLARQEEDIYRLKRLVGIK
jgi:predicted nuclease with TOPRIM domain